MSCRRCIVFVVFVVLFFTLNAAFVFAFWAEEDAHGTPYPLSRLQRQLGRYDMVIAGDSRSEWALAPSRPYLRRALSVSGLGDGYAVSFYKVARVVDFAPNNVRTVVLALGRDSFGSVRTEQSAYEYYARSYDFLDLILRRGDLRTHVPEFLKFKVFPYLNWPGHIESRIPPGVDRPHIERFSSVPNQLERAEKRSRERLRSPAVGDRWNDEAVYYFERLLALCREQNIRVVAINFPVSEAYYNEIEELFPSAQFGRQVRELLAGWPEVLYLDYERLFFGRDDLLWDPDHLNCYGAEVFSAQLEQDLRSNGIVLPTADTAEEQSYEDSVASRGPSS